MSNNDTGIRPNILWITTHDISPDLGCYAGVWPGAEYAITPNLDELAASGARYDNAFASAPVCAPSRSAIITGMFPTAIGTMHMRTKAAPPPEVRCFTEYMRAAGYYCTNSGMTDYQFETPVTAYDDAGPQAHWRNRPDPDQPFFSTFHGMITHESQIHAPAEQIQQVMSTLTPEQHHDPAAAPIPPYYPDTPVYRQIWAQYADLITAMDAWAGNLLRQLDEDGLADNTLVVFWSDHGVGLPRAKRYPYESGLREPLIVRWPGKIAPGTVRKDLVYLLDLAATTLTVAGLPLPVHMHSQPIFDADGTPTSNPRPYVCGGRDRMDEQEDTIRTVRDARFRYIRNYHPDRPYLQHHDYAEHMSSWQELRRLRFEEANQLAAGETPDRLTPVQRQFLASSKPAEELYDVVTDPYEINNLADDPAYAEDMARLRGQLDSWQEQYGDLGLMPESELIEHWRPGGVTQVTAEPIISSDDGLITVRCSTDGASIGWTVDPPGEDVSPIPFFFRKVTGDPQTGGRHWNLYSGPFAPPDGSTIRFRAQRIGYEASEVEVVPAALVAR